MKIIVFFPIWKRPEIVYKCVQALCKLKPKGIELMPFSLLSEEDQFYSENRHTLEKFDIPFGHGENFPVGFKKNETLCQAIKYYKDYDYTMEIGSDDFINPKLFDLYNTLMSEEIKFFGLNNTFAYSLRYDKLILVKDYAGENMTFGGCRMIHRTIIEDLGCKLWPGINEGLDTMSAVKIRKAGYHETVIDAGEFPYFLDVKTDTHICPFEFMEGYLDTKEMDKKLLKEFGYEK